MDFSQKFKLAKDYFLDLIFPKFCVGCNLEGEWICQNCHNKIVMVATQVCPDCNRISAHGRYCVKCRKKHRLSGIIVITYYEEGPIKEAIHNLKYNNVTELGDFLGKMMVGPLKDNLNIINDKVILTAVPMHFLRQAQRGYNQSEILANIIGNELKIEKNFKIIKKFRKTKSQVKFSGKKRRENLKNSFKIIDKNTVKNRTVIIVDDVTTTGATLEECAKVLREAGVKRVWGLVVARG